MGSPFDGADGVHERERVLVEAVVVLQSNLDIHVVPKTFDVDRRIVKGLVTTVQALYEFHHPSLKLEVVALVAAFVLDPDLEPGVQEGKFAKTLGQRVERVVQRLENLTVGKKGELGSIVLCSNEQGLEIRDAEKAAAVIIDLVARIDNTDTLAARRVIDVIRDMAIDQLENIEGGYNVDGAIDYLKEGTLS